MINTTIANIKITPIVPVHTPALKIVPITSHPEASTDINKIAGSIAIDLFVIKCFVESDDMFLYP